MLEELEISRKIVTIQTAAFELARILRRVLEKCHSVSSDGYHLKLMRKTHKETRNQDKIRVDEDHSITKLG